MPYKKLTQILFKHWRKPDEIGAPGTYFLQIPVELEVLVR